MKSLTIFLCMIPAVFYNILLRITDDWFQERPCVRRPTDEVSPPYYAQPTPPRFPTSSIFFRSKLFDCGLINDLKLKIDFDDLGINEKSYDLNRPHAR